MKSRINKTLLLSVKPSSRPFEINDTELPGFLLRVQPTGGMSYACTYRLKSTGKRDRVVFGRHPVITPQQARDEAKKVLGDVARGVDPKQIVRERRRDVGKPTLGDFLTNTYASWAESNLADGNQSVIRMRRVFSGLLAQRLSELTVWQFEKWKLERQQQRPKPATINRELAAIRSVLAKAVDWGFLEVHPMSKVKQIRSVDDKRIRFLTEAEEKRLRTALSQREERIREARVRFNEWRTERSIEKLPTIRPDVFADHAAPIILFALNTGLRRGELFSLAWEDVELSANVSRVKVRAAAAKSRRPRYVPLNTEARDALLRWRGERALEPKSLIFPGQDGKSRLTNVNRSWAGVTRMACIEDFRFHDLRHHFASRLVMSGVDLNTVRELLGHADIKMTLRYAHLAPEHKAVAVEKIVRAA